MQFLAAENTERKRRALALLSMRQHLKHYYKIYGTWRVMHQSQLNTIRQSRMVQADLFTPFQHHAESV